MADENLFEAANKGNEPAYIDQYVGDGKKYSSVEELAKAYAHAEKHINDTVEDNKSLKEFISAQLEQFATQREQVPPAPNDADNGRQPDHSAPPKDGDKEDIDTRILKILEERDRNTRLKKNAELAEEVMISHLGSKEEAVRAVQVKAAEMGVAPQFLADMAFQSPKAFFNLMGVDPDSSPRNPNTPDSKGDVNPLALAKNTPGAKPGTYAFYEQLRKSDPAKYNSAEVQQAMMRDALANRDTFFKR